MRVGQVERARQIMQAQREQRVGQGRQAAVLAVLLLASGGFAGCKDLTGSQQLPSGTVNPAFYDTPAGVMGLRAQALYALEHALPSYVTNTGLLTDELQSNDIGASAAVTLSQSLADQDAVDARLLPEATYGSPGNGLTDFNYTQLQVVRADLGQALAAIAVYDTGAKAVGDPRHLRAELFALRGYTEILLADFFCSGVPLSTLDFQGDYTYHASSTTAEVYHDAIVQEDSALSLADTSIELQSLARVLRGRALLNLDSAAVAAQVVAPVPDGFQYLLAVNFSQPNFRNPGANSLNAEATVADTEGRNGLPYLSSNDPRTAATIVVQPPIPSGNVLPLPFVPLTFPTKYSASTFSPFVIADGVEARLIQAEAQLQSAGSPNGLWLTTLNQLRESIGLSDTTDPGTAQGRIALVFRERAFWLFLTGHRQGDLRRLLRQYPQWFGSDTQVYPTGLYTGFGTRTYGNAVTAPIPATETLNPLFHGCIDRNP